MLLESVDRALAPIAFAGGGAVEPPATALARDHDPTATEIGADRASGVPLVASHPVGPCSRSAASWVASCMGPGPRRPPAGTGGSAWRRFARNHTASADSATARRSRHSIPSTISRWVLAGRCGGQWGASTAHWSSVDPWSRIRRGYPFENTALMVGQLRIEVKA